jgi:O-antigen/teichoic acid export membrane protein
VFGEILIGRAVAAVELAVLAHGHAVRASWVRLSTIIARALTAAVVFVILRHDSVAAWALATLVQSIVCALALLAAARALYGPPRLRFDASEIGFGLLLMVNQVSRSLNSNIDRIVLSLFLAPAALGVYASGTRLQMVNGILNHAATRLFYVRFFRAGAAGREPASSRPTAASTC